jgi:uncharacterized membrane protein
MMFLLAIHIAAGSVALVAGFIGVFSVKGMKVHRRSGTVFLYSMIALGVSGATIAVIRSQPANIVGGSIAVYMVSTGVLTLRRRDGGSYWLDGAGIALALGIVYFSLSIGLQVLRSPSGKIDGVPPAPLFVFAGVTSLALLGDLRMMLMRGLQGKQRLVRHLWRMCFALFIASGSFFLGQAKVIPKPLRILPLLAIPAFLPLIAMLYWVARVSFTKWYRRRGAGLVQPTPVTG